MDANVHAPILVWSGPDYAKVPPGTYQAIVVNWQGPEWVRSFNRWSLRVSFYLLGEGVEVSIFYNFGQNRQKPYIGRRSKFYRDWVLANGEQPRKEQVMTLDVFKEGQTFTIRVEDAEIQDTGVYYSKVAEIVNVASR